MGHSIPIQKSLFNWKIESDAEDRERVFGVKEPRRVQKLSMKVPAGGQPPVRSKASRESKARGQGAEYRHRSPARRDDRLHRGKCQRPIT